MAHTSRKRGGRPRNRGRASAPSEALERVSAVTGASARGSDAPSALALTEAEVERQLAANPHLGAKRREEPWSITVVRLPEEPRIDHYPDSHSFLMALHEGDDSEPDYRHVRASIPRHRLREVALEGGLYTYLEQEHGPGKYKILWNARDLHVIGCEVHEIPDLERLDRERKVEAQREHDERLEREDRERREAFEARRQRESEQLLNGWAREVALGFMVQIARQVPSGPQAEQLHAAVLRFLELNAPSFVRVTPGRYVYARVPVRRAGRRGFDLARRWDPQGLTLVLVSPPQAVFAALRAFGPPPEARA